MALSWGAHRPRRYLLLVRNVNMLSRMYAHRLQPICILQQHTRTLGCRYHQICLYVITVITLLRYYSYYVITDHTAHDCSAATLVLFGYPGRLAVRELTPSRTGARGHTERPHPQQSCLISLR